MKFKGEKKAMKRILIVLLATVSMSAFAALRFFDSNGAQLGIENEFKCGSGLSCAITNGKVVATPAQSAFTGNATFTGSITGDGGDTFSGFLQPTVTATATTITAVQCGSTFINSGAIAINLPEASTVVGCRLTFITANASNFDVNPDDADQILVLTNAAGDSIRNATLGNSVVLQAINASQWAPIGKEQGTYSDIN